EQCHYNDQKSVRKAVVNMIAAKYKILDACANDTDLRCAIEIMETANATNALHLAHMYEIACGISESDMLLGDSHYMDDIELLDCIQLEEVMKQSRPFREAVKRIPPLTSHMNIVDKICIVFWKQSRETDANEREALFFKSVELSNRLLNLCVDLDHKVE
ncbi:hypothetical protein HDU99_006527, partial [Rhizoclosmatium hyalinum]